MANPYEVYRNQRAAGWTRVDMILALYDEAIKYIDDAIAALTQEKIVDSRRHCLRVIQVVACLRSGLDAEGGDLPKDILRLFHFVDGCMTGGKLSDLDAARNVLAPIRESYRQIRDSAADMERKGEIPSLTFDEPAGRLI